MKINNTKISRAKLLFVVINFARIYLSTARGVLSIFLPFFFFFASEIFYTYIETLVFFFFFGSTVFTTTTTLQSYSGAALVLCVRLKVGGGRTF